jgi:crotonobetainyl-CoA:carnitine CoA-transferase CaiB-like acyl-CoA transferase
MDLFERRPSETYADHARGDRELQRELQAIFLTRTTDQWVALGGSANCPVARVNDPASIAHDPGFAARLPWLPASEYGTDLMPTPVKLVGEEPVHSRPAPTPGEHTDEVLREVLQASAERIAELRAAGAFGPDSAS